MAGLRPIGSEKLEGMDKIRRIMEIARYNENIPQSINETKSTEYKISLADGNTYEIVKERQGYIIKQSINESENDYIEPMKNRKYFSSYSQALKRLNLMTKEINTLHENEEGTPLLGEQKKKFILKTNKPKAAELTPEPVVEPAAELPAPPTPEPEIPSELPADMGAPSPEMGDEESAFSPDMEGGEEEEMEIDVEEKPKEKKVSDIKRIQILVGKLSQKIRSYEEEKELSAQNVKYIINSILSAIDVDVLDEDDIEEIISKLEGGDEDDEEGGEEVSFEEEGMEEPETDMEGEVPPPPSPEEEMAEGYDTFADAFQDYLPSAYSAEGSKNLGEEDEYGEIDDEYHRERRRGRKHYPDVDRFTHGTFSESTVDKVLSKYFVISEEEKDKSERKTNLQYKKNKENIIKLSESTEQLDVALDYIRENPRVKLMGITNKGSLMFKEGINDVKITKRGEII
jgi:hypothetical protein